MKNFIGVGPTEDEQEQQIKDWIKTNGMQIVAGVAIGLSAIWGLDAYQAYQHTQAVEARTHYLNLSVNPNNTQAYAALQQDFADSSYNQQAELMLAKTAVDAGDFNQALGHLTPLTQVENTLIANVAKLRASALHVELGQYEQALSLLNTTADDKFSGLFNHAKGDAYLAKGETQSAIEHYQLAKAQISADSALQNLIQIKLDDLR